MDAPVRDSKIGLTRAQRISTSYQDPKNHQREPWAPHDIEQWISINHTELLCFATQMVPKRDLEK